MDKPKLSKCPDCGGKLEQGARIDYAHSWRLIQRYAKIDLVNEGINWWKVFPWDNQNKVLTLRCTECNRLFDYVVDYKLIEDDGGYDPNKNRMERF